MTTEKIWIELADQSKKLHEESKNRKLPNEVSLEEFAEYAGVHRTTAYKLLKQLLEAGIITTRKDGCRRYYSPK
jgi:DNA-binding transcriptional ArsR family regulator